MKTKNWLAGWLCIVTVLLGVIGAVVYYMDPYMHYHAPCTDRFYYKLENQRYQNDGIIRNFDYDAVITGTSMTEQFRTSETDALFGTESVKVPYSGASYKEVNDSLERAFRRQPGLRLVIRGLDMNRFFDSCEAMEYERAEYPVYLYNENPFDDVKYLFNRDVAVMVYQMFARAIQGVSPGLTSFDEYCMWQEGYVFGINSLYPDGLHYQGAGKVHAHLTSEEKLRIEENIRMNVTSLAERYPEVTFCYFFPPYSAVWWMGLAEAGEVYHQVEAEQYVIELLLEYDNIRLFSFNNRIDITTDLNHYKDPAHYASWINSLILRLMYEGECLLTKENYLDYLDQELQFYTTFDYESLNEQEDYAHDEDAAAILNQE